MHLPHKESHSYRKTKRGKSVKFDIKTQELNIMSSHAKPTPKKKKWWNQDKKRKSDTASVDPE